MRQFNSNQYVWRYFSILFFSDDLSELNTISFSHSFQANGIVQFVRCVHFAVHDVPKVITIRIWRSNKSKNCWPWPNGRTNIKRIQWQKNRSTYRCCAHRVWQSNTVQLKIHTSIELEQNPEIREEERESDKISAEMLFRKSTVQSSIAVMRVIFNEYRELESTAIKYCLRLNRQKQKCPQISIEIVQLNVQQQQISCKML